MSGRVCYWFNNERPGRRLIGSDERRLIVKLRQDAMTSKQVMLGVTMAFLCGCAGMDVIRQTAPPLASPYADRRVLAVAPLDNQSGSLHADVLRIADELAQQLEQAGGIDVLPVNRSLEAINALRLTRLAAPADAEQLLKVLGADALLVGTVTAYQPYDPPRLGLAIELYVRQPARRVGDSLNVRRLSRTASDATVEVSDVRQVGNPVTRISAVFDASSPLVRRAMRQYAFLRGADVDDTGLNQYNPWRPDIETHESQLYRINMDLFTQFVSYEMCWRLLAAEEARLAEASTAPAGP